MRIEAGLLLTYAKVAKVAEQEEVEEAVAVLTEAAAQGHVEAQAHLGSMYCFGEGVARDDARAFELYRQPVLQGDAVSQCNLGAMYQQGIGCEQSHERAVEWWAKAAEQGQVSAQYNLGRAHYLGEGLPQSYERAIELFRLSEAQGHADATANMGVCYANGHGVDQSHAEARRLYELAVARDYETELTLGNVQQINDHIQQHCPLLGQRVVLRGLATVALNETRGTAVDFGYSERNLETGIRLVASGRYTDGAAGRGGGVPDQGAGGECRGGGGGG